MRLWHFPTALLLVVALVVPPSFAHGEHGDTQCTNADGCHYHEKKLKVNWVGVVALVVVGWLLIEVLDNDDDPQAAVQHDKKQAFKLHDERRGTGLFWEFDLD